MNSRRILLLISIVVLLMIIGLALYFVFSPKNSTTGTQTGKTGTLPIIGAQPTSTIGNNTTTTNLLGTSNASISKSFGVISDVAALDYFTDKNNVVTIVEPDGEILEITNGASTILNSLQIQNIIKTGFSYDGSKVLVNFGDPLNPQTSIFDIPSRTWTPMPAGWRSPTWSPSDYRIAYLSQSANNETLTTFDPTKNKSNATPLITLHAQDLSLTWLNKNQLIIQTKPSAFIVGSMWNFNLINDQLMPIITETQGVEVIWQFLDASATTTAMGLEFSANSGVNGGSLELIDTHGNTLKNMNFLTLPSKCLFGNTTSSYLYCAIPRDQQGFSSAVIPDSYDQLALFTSDDIYRINLVDGSLSGIFTDASQNMDVSDVKFANNTLFFINRYDQKLYGVQLVSGN